MNWFQRPDYEDIKSATHKLLHKATYVVAADPEIFYCDISCNDISIKLIKLSVCVSCSTAPQITEIYLLLAFSRWMSVFFLKWNINSKCLFELSVKCEVSCTACLLLWMWRESYRLWLTFLSVMDKKSCFEIW